MSLAFFFSLMASCCPRLHHVVVVVVVVLKCDVALAQIDALLKDVNHRFVAAGCHEPKLH